MKMLTFLMLLSCSFLLFKESFAQQPHLKALNTFGSKWDPQNARNESAKDLVEATNDAFYFAGRICDTVDMLPGPDMLLFKADTPGNCNPFVGKFNKNGIPIWVKKLAASAYISSVQSTTNGDLILSGFYTKTLDIDPDSLRTNIITYTNGMDNNFLLRMDSTGNLIWVKTFKSTSLSFVAKVLDSSIYLMGGYSGTFDIDPNDSIQPITGSGNYFIVKLNQNAQFKWVDEWYPVTGSSYLIDLQLNKDGNLVTGINYNGFVDIDPGPNTLNKSSVGSHDFGVLTLNSQNGSLLNATFWQSKDYAYIDRLATTPKGEILLIGRFKDSLDADPGTGLKTLMGDLGYTIYVLKVDSSFQLKWAGKFGGNYVDAYRLAVDRDNNIIIGGKFNYDMDFDPDTSEWIVTNPSQMTGYVLKINEYGKLSNVFILNNVILCNFAFTRINSLIIAGSFKLNVAFDIDSTNKLTNVNGENDLFIASYTHCKSSTYSMTINTCPSFTIDAVTYTRDTFVQVRTETINDCDSILNLNIKIVRPNKTVTVTATTLTSNETNATYQWINCNSKNIITGQNSKTFTPNQSGKYAVIVTKNTCSDTSTCIDFIKTGVHQINNSHSISIYPNPVKQYIYINRNGISQDLNYEITNALGQTFLSGELKQGVSIDVGENIGPGMYFIKLRGQDTNSLGIESIFRFIKQ